MAVLSPTPKMQFLDAAGAPLVGGKVYTYAAGTTTPQATYTDNTGATPNTNPVILDSRGEADIWLGGATYKFILFNADNVEIWSVDYISAPTSSVSPVLSGNVVISSSSSGAALSITQSGTGLALRVVSPVDPDTTLFAVDSGGRVGIGTASPSAGLDILDQTAQISSPLGVARSKIYADASNSYYTAESTRNFVIKTNNAARLTLNDAAATSTVPVVLPSDPTTALQAATKQYVDSLPSVLAPPGVIAPYAAPSAPTGWLACDGAAVSRATYAALFAAIGTVWGAGDGATTFNLPDFRGQFLRGYDGRVPGLGGIDTTVVSGIVTSGSPLVTGLPDTTYLYAGMPVTGTGISAGTTISSKTSSTITLSANATSSSGVLTCGTTSGSPNITTASTSVIFIGQAVSGTGIPTGAYIVNIYNATTFTISANATATNASASLSFGNTLTMGRTFASAQDDSFQNHTHGVNDPTHTHTVPAGFFGGGSFGATSGSFATSSTSDAAATGISVNQSASGESENRPKNYAILYIIKT